MIAAITTVKSTMAMVGIATASTVIGSMAQAAVNETTPISLGAAVGVGGVVVGGAWFLSSKLTKIDDRLNQIEKKIGINGHYKQPKNE